MKRLIALLLCLIAAPAFGATLTITGMTAASAPDGTELLECVQGGNSRKCTINQVKTFTSASPTLVTPNIGAATGTSLTLSGNLTAANMATAGTITSGNLCRASSGTEITCDVNTAAEIVTAVSDLNSATRTATNLTYDTQGTGNVFKMLDTIQLTHPHNCDGTGATISTTATAIDYGRATYSNSADQAANYCEYRITVPFDIDTSVELTGRIQFRLGNTDTGTHRYVLSTVTQADSSAAAGTPGTAINLDFAGDGSGASGDIESVGFTTLTGWAATMTADRLLVIRLARDGNATEDGSSVNSTVMNLILKYGRSQ